MLIDDVRPTTLDGLKRLAGDYRKRSGLRHTAALDVAAKAAGCENYRHARRVLMRPAEETPPYVYLTTYWLDRDRRSQVGRETLRIDLSKPLDEICDRSGLRRARGFGSLRMVAADHFVCDDLYRSQSEARAAIFQAERTLRFMEHTALRQAPYQSRPLRRDRVLRELPGKDHSSHWVDPRTGTFVLVDEPYSDRSRDGERAAWARRHGWEILKTDWPGMYNPYACDLYIAAESTVEYFLARLKTKIEATPAHPLERLWDGVSDPSWTTFVSPLAATPQDHRRARCRGTIFPTESATTLPCSYNVGTSRRRPRGELGIEGHRQVGRMIKAVLHSDQRPWSVHQRMNSLRSTLEDWLGMEIGSQALQGPEFFEVYYHELDIGDPYVDLARTRAGLLTMLSDIRQRLTTAYPDCAPLRRQLRRIDFSSAVIGRARAR